MGGWQSSLHWLACRVLENGPLPRHVAFIMDGNRRFARRRELPRVDMGHQLGYERLEQVRVGHGGGRSARYDRRRL